MFYVVGRGIYLGDEKFVATFEFCGKLLVDGLQASAVRTPGSVELYQHIVVWSFRS